MLTAKIFFGISLAFLLYTYAGYAVLLFIINSIKKLRATPAKQQHTGYEPVVTLIIPAYNEAMCLETKVSNCFSLDYPAHKLNFIFITDGSTDNSNAIIQQYSRIQLLYEPERKGKMAAINRAMKFVTTPIVIFSDANSFLNKDCIQQVVKHFSNSKVGGVAGEKKIDFKNSASIGLGEGLYWKYESALKQLDSDFNTVVGAAGELFSMRTELFNAQNENTILDDFVLSLKICMKGYKVVYEPKAYAIEAPSADLGEEHKRRVRIAAGAFQSLFKMGALFNFIKHPLLSFQYLSRRVSRWLLCPVSLVVLYASNAWLFLNAPSLFATYFFAFQNMLYLFAFLGWLFYRLRFKFSLFFIPFYFVFMNVALVEGFARFITGRQPAMWDKAQRNRMQVLPGSL